MEGTFYWAYITISTFNFMANSFVYLSLLTADMAYERNLIDHYELGEKIGTGGFGAVHAGICKKTRNLVSLFSRVLLFIFLFGGCL